MSTAFATFGSGGAEPYARALLRDDRTLYLHSEAHKTSFEMDLSRWSEDADATDFRLLAGATGPVLDIGCGPGRMVKAAMGQGLAALGIDVSQTAIDIARESGLMVLKRSVFDRLPREGQWGSALLVDGNIGIGGDPLALLARCAELIATAGAVIVEVHADPERDRAYNGTLVDIHGQRSAEFPWAEVGRDALETYGRAAGLRLDQAWVTDGRGFCRLVTA